MDERIEGLLLKLAEEYAPELARRYDRSGALETRAMRLARSLANYGLLVIMGDQPYSLQKVGRSANRQIEQWVQGYAQMYHLLCRELFPSFNQIHARDTDNRWPVVIGIKGEAIPVIQRIAGFIAPYLAHRQLTPVVSEAELIGLMEVVLDELEAASLAPDTYRQLRVEGVGLLRAMLVADIRYLSLTDFDRTLFTDSQRFVPARPSRPPVLPESAASRTDDTSPLSSTQSLNPEPPRTAQDSGSIPVFFKRDSQPANAPRPPLRPLPKSDDSER